MSAETALVKLVDDESETKICASCKKDKQLDEFALSFFGTRKRTCRDCHRTTLGQRPRSYLRDIAASVGLAFTEDKPREDDEDDHGVDDGSLWDLSRPETLSRFERALDGVWNAYIRGSKEHGHAAFGAFDAEARKEVFVTIGRIERGENVRLREPTTPEEKTMTKWDEHKARMRNGVLAHLETTGPSRLSTIAEALGMTSAPTTKVLKDLLKSGAIVQDGTPGTKSSSYRLPTQQPLATEEPSEKKPPKPGPAPKPKTVADVAKKHTNGKPVGVLVGDPATLKLRTAIDRKRAELAGLEHALAIIEGQA